ncbi:MAG TPA: hypothetical protein VFJ74_10115, partial [Gemmatimonadaceae bacterium]|nr:hypothetical protein [Gemmatimonadaceae bacterium]
MLARLASLLLAPVDLSVWLPALFDAAIKGTLLLAAAALLASAMRRSSAALRHFVWSVAVAGVVLLPVLSRVLPAWDAPVIPAIALASRSVGAAVGGAVDRSAALSPASPVAPAQDAGDDAATSRSESRAAVTTPGNPSFSSSASVSIDAASSAAASPTNVSPIADPPAAPAESAPVDWARAV